MTPRTSPSSTCSAFVALACAASFACANPLPEAVTYDTTVPTGEQVFGFEVGERHLSHDELLRYFEAVAGASERVQLVEIGSTHEMRRHVLAIISTPENLARLEDLRSAHVAYADGLAETPGPLVAWFVYSVHGNETSGAHASTYTVYHLAAAPLDALEVNLGNTVVIIEPSANPDGMQRFTSWVNAHRNRIEASDPNHREHREAWPNGRTNHYWFDLNRDWLLLQHPESRSRVEWYQRWLPHVVGDYHEMGTSATYFFQPGVPSRNNPLTSARTVELTAQIARFHARALDAFAQPYFTREAFDDFYYGKGSTYPDLQGSVGVLFEQASARGLAQRSPNGTVTLKQAIRNQFATSRSLLAGAQANRQALAIHQRSTRRDALAAGKATGGGWVFSTPGDPHRGYSLARLLAGHDIEVFRQAQAPQHAFLVPAEQIRFRLVQTLFEPVTEFADPTFYDVSAWNADLAYDIDVTRVSALPARGERVLRTSPLAPGALHGDSATAVAYVLDWQRSESPPAAATWLREGLRLRVMTEPFGAEVDGQMIAFERGAVVALIGTQSKSRKTLDELVAQVIDEERAHVYALSTGLTPVGPDLGGRSTAAIGKAKLLLLAGPGTSAYEVGEIWHLTDKRLGLPTTLVELDQLERLSLRAYSHVLMADGDYEDLDAQVGERLRDYACGGGTVIAQRRAAKWWAEQPVTRLRVSELPPSGLPASYGDRAEVLQRERIAGAILASRVDLTHPLAFGLPDERLPMFHKGELRFRRVADRFANVAVYDEEAPVLSGFVSPENAKRLGGSVAVIAEPVGRGRLILFADVPNFRAYFRGSQRMYSNGLFFNSAIEFDRAIVDQAEQRCRREQATDMS
ncbi:MAG: M14 family zinc carboxypeptidase [Pseudomonadota bacterium]